MAWSAMVITAVEGKVMLNKALYIPLIMGLMCLQVSLQTVRGEEFEEDGVNYYQYNKNSPQERPNSVKVISLGNNSLSDIESDSDKTPQANCQWWVVWNHTGSNGIYRADVRNGYFGGQPVCSCLHRDAKHQVNSSVADNVQEVRSWASWGEQVGPIWFSCMLLVCLY